MSDELRILFIEDSAQDVELEVRELQKAGFKVQARRVETPEEITRGLEEFQPILIISDHFLPKLNGLDALGIVRRVRTDIPFIFVSGTIGEERAIESLKNGATDYVLKDHLGGLVSKVRRALREVEERAEHRRVEEQLRQAQKMEAVGRLAGGVAHDFNNLLTVINGFSELLLGMIPGEHPFRPDLEEILRAGQRGASLTRQLLTFSRRHATQAVMLDLNAVVSGVEKMLYRLVGGDVKIALSLAPDLRMITADPGHVEQVIMNLVVNARDAMPKGGKVTIETANVELAEDYVRAHPQASLGPHVSLSVTDTGVGITPEVMTHLFEPFFTTKEVGKGTGLGLSTVHGIVKQAGGSIEVSSRVDQGSTFRVFFPRATKETRVRHRPPAPQGVFSGTETILISEDQESVRRVATTILETTGYKVLHAKDGTEALRICEDHEGPIDLLITDLVMRTMTGVELIGLVRRLHPRIKVILMSGYADREIETLGSDNAEIPFIQKPFTVDEFRRTVREVLSQ